MGFRFSRLPFLDKGCEMKKYTTRRYATLLHLASYVCRKENCYFCGWELIESGIQSRYGTEIGKGEIGITIHHIDNNKENTAIENLALCHRRCHQRFHGTVNRREQLNKKRGVKRWEE